MQDAISKYYQQKAHIDIKDQYHEEVDERDIHIMKKSLGYVIATPFISIGIMYMAKEVKKETSMTSHFVGSIRRI